jgi:hypothetical protein
MRYKWFRGTGFKKYKVELYEKGEKIKTIQFGDKRYEQYKDVTPLKLYSHLNHLDKDRRKRYKIRHEKDRHTKYTAGWFADKFLW